jgi:hypothetical protein
VRHRHCTRDKGGWPRLETTAVERPSLTRKSAATVSWTVQPTVQLERDGERKRQRTTAVAPEQETKLDRAYSGGRGHSR